MAASINPMQISWPQTIRYEEGLDRLKRLIELIQAKISSENSKLLTENIGFLKVLCLALEAEHELINYLNDENINSPLAWDIATGFPSHPTLIADVQKYTGVFKAEDSILSATMRSFDHWENLAQETSVRSSGVTSVLKNVRMTIKINHVLKTMNGWLNFKQLVGVESTDLSEKELLDYFDFRLPSKVIDGLIIILKREMSLRVQNDKLEIEKVSTEKAGLFNLGRFQQIIDQLQTAY